MPAPIERACTVCGRGFVPRHKENRHCTKCEPRGRAHRSPTTQAQDAEYNRNRKLILAGSPRCAVRTHCDGAPATTADHIRAVARGGTNALTNLQPSCARCNFSKGARGPSPASASAPSPPVERAPAAALRLS